MNPVIRLTARNMAAEKEKIEKNQGMNPIYVLDTDTPLHEYIGYLHEALGVSNEVLFHFRVCRELTFPNKAVTVEDKSAKKNPHTMSELLTILDSAVDTSIVIENDDRTLLANILQQLIYIDYPTTKVNMQLRREFKDAARTLRFMQRADTLHEYARKAIEEINNLAVAANAANADDLYKKRAQALCAYKKIEEQIAKAKKLEMKVAAAASKNTGKSVIINDMLGMELAPTSLRLATPNTCIYRRSYDQQFHLDYAGTSSNFDSADELYKVINQQFHEAEKNAEKGYSIPDMVISYVPNGNNFETYTLYDTPGPDLAGANHGEIAAASMEKADVVIFAIDYSKYLTITEEEFLGKVKRIFEEKKKFHTLIFVINKIDLALQDKGTKSRIAAIDFIRCKLGELAEQYKDCVIFATSAQDYFYTLELEAAARSGMPFANILAPLMQEDTNLYRAIRDVTDELESDGCKDESLMRVLSNIDAEVGKLRRQLGYSKVFLRDLRAFSGMPQLLSYVAYVAQSKARDEIINSIAYTIDQQKVEIQNIIDYITNLETLINLNEQEIIRIRRILERYQKNVSDTMQEVITEEDMSILEKSGISVKASLQDLKTKSKFPAKLGDLLDIIYAKIDWNQSEGKTQQDLWNEYLPKQREHIQNLIGEVIAASDLQQKLTLSAEQMDMIVGNYVANETAIPVKMTMHGVEDTRKCLQILLQHRFQIVKTYSQNCQNELNKEGISLQVPELPVFDATIAPPQQSYPKVNITSIRFERSVGDIFKKHGSIWTFFYSLWYNKSIKGKTVKIEKIAEKRLDELLESIKGDFYNAVTDSRLNPQLKDYVGELKDYVESIRSQLNEEFSGTLEKCQEKATQFLDAVDDRKRYQSEVDNLNRMKALIDGISKASADFLKEWMNVLGTPDA